jgi:hypothetical protein
MAYCPGSGASEVIPTGPQVSVSLTGTVLAAALGFVAPEIAGVVAAIIGAINIELPVICGSPPPPYPTTSELATALAGLYGTTTEVASLVELATQWVVANQWPNYCQCVTGPQPTPPAATAGPTSQPTVPGANQAGSPCLTFVGNLLNLGYAHGPAPLNISAGSSTTVCAVLPAGATSILWNFEAQQQGGSGTQGTFTVSWYAADNTTVIATDVFDAWAGSTPTTYVGWWAQGATIGSAVTSTGPAVNGLGPGLPIVTTSVPAGAVFVGVNVTNPGPTSGYTGAVAGFCLGAVYCNGSSPTSTGCCPPDPAITSALAQIQVSLAQLLASLPALGVTSYASGVAHTALSSYGALTFVGVPVGVKVNLTTIPTAIGRVIGDPEYYFNAGYISLQTEQGALAPVRVTYDGQFIPFTALISSLDYTFGPGVIATITEITAGP